MIKRVRIVRILLLLAAMVAAALAWQRASSWYGRFMRQTAQEEVARAVPRMEAGVVFYLALDRPAGQDSALPAFGLWHLSPAEDAASSGEDAAMNTNEQTEMAEAGTAAEEDSFSLFLPGAARRTGLRVQFEGELLLDGQPLASGQLLELAEGEHLIETPAGRWPFTAMYGSDLPCLFMEMSSGSLDAVHAQKGAMDLACATLIQTDGLAEYLGSIWVKGHGNTSWFSKKPSYQINLDERMGLLGMAAARHWLLLGNPYDKTLLRNQTAFFVAQAVGMPYTPNSQQIELYVQGEYRGCYLLCEKVEVDDSRVNIPDMDEMNQAAVRGIGAGWNESPDLCGTTEWDEWTAPGSQRYYELAAEVPPESGGYLFELDISYRSVSSGNPGFITRKGRGITIKSPAFATKRQVEYLAALFQQLEDINYPLNGSMPSATLDQLIDLHSFAQKYLIEEITENHDANTSSQYFYKLPDSISTKLYAGPVWDYDYAFSNDDFGESFGGIKAFWANQRIVDYAFWAGLYDDPNFRQEVYQCFWEEYVPVIDRMLDEGWFEQQEQELSASACMDMYRWQGRSDPEAYRQSVAEFEDFLDLRMEFLKNEWQKDPSEWVP